MNIWETIKNRLYHNRSFHKEVIGDHSFNLFHLSSALIIGISNQVISSGTSFFLSLFLIRFLSPEDFGLYGIGIAISLFYGGIGNALFLIQMVVFYPDKKKDDQNSYITRMFISVLLFALVTVIVFIFVFIFGGFISDQVQRFKEFGMAMLAVSITYLLKDFFVRYSYIIRKESLSLLMNSAVAISLIVSITVIHFITHTSLNAVVVLWLCFFGNIVGAIIGLYVSKLPFRQVRLLAVFKDAREALNGGWWAGLGSCIVWMKSQSFMLVLSFFLGPVAVGQANAARLVVVPLTLVVTAINQIILPRLADIRNTNRRKLFTIGKWYSISLLLSSFVYFAILLSFWDFIKLKIFGTVYGNLNSLVFAWCAVIFFQLSWTGTSLILQVLKMFRLLTIANGFGAIFAVVASLIFANLLGGFGAILGTAVGELILSIILYRVMLTESI